MSCWTHLRPLSAPAYRSSLNRRIGAIHSAGKIKYVRWLRLPRVLRPKVPPKANETRACLATLDHDAVRHVARRHPSAVGAQGATPWPRRTRARPGPSSRCLRERRKLRPANDRPGTLAAGRERDSQPPGENATDRDRLLGTIGGRWRRASEAAPARLAPCGDRDPIARRACPHRALDAMGRAYGRRPTSAGPRLAYALTQRGIRRRAFRPQRALSAERPG